jgi:hypothetical protein
MDPMPELINRSHRLISLKILGVSVGTQHQMFGHESADTGLLLVGALGSKWMCCLIDTA